MVTMGDQNELQISWFFHDDDDTIFLQHSLTQKAFYIKAVAFTHYTSVLETVTFGSKLSQTFECQTCFLSWEAWLSLCITESSVKIRNTWSQIHNYIFLLFCNWSTYLSLKWTEAGAFGVSGGRVLKGVALAFSIVQGPVPGPAQHTVENGALGLKNRLGIVTLITVPVGNKNKNSRFFFF